MKALLITMAEWLVQTIGSFGYSGIVIMMAIESSVIPLPSEVIMPPAGYLISQGEMSWGAVILAGSVGSLIGALVNYYVSKFLGRPILEKYGKYFFVKKDHLEKCDQFFLKHGEIATFLGRLLPGVRHLISIPAGLSNMNIFKFSFYTLLGASIWVTILTYIGHLVGKNRELIHEYLSTTTIWVIIGCGVVIGVYYLISTFKKKEISFN